MIRRALALSVALACGLVAAAASAAAERVRIAYFLGWPTPNLVAKADGAYEAALGLPVTWIAFDTGTQMTEALAAGDVDIAYSQGLAPFVTALREGAPVTAVGVAVEYPANDCIVREGSGRDADDPASFVGAAVALPLATMADYSFRMTTRALGIDAGRMTVLDRIPSEAAIALTAGEVDVACGFGALATAKMARAGEPMMDAEAKRAAGIASFDLITASTPFARENPELVRAFLALTERANAAWAGTPGQLERVGLESGLDRSALIRQLEDFEFPDAAEQRGRLLGPGGVGLEAMAVAGEALAGDDDSATAPDYADAVDRSYLP